MATFRKRGPYQWQAIIRRKGYPEQTKTFETKAEALAWSATIESEMMRGVWRHDGDAGNTTLSECLERYKKEVTPKKKGAAQENYKIKILSDSSLAPCFMLNIRSKDVADYRDQRISEGRSANTIKNELNLLSAVFETCRKEWGMETLTNVVKDVSRPTPPKGRDRRLAAHEEEIIMRMAKANRSLWIAPIITIALETAMRQGEIAGLEWKHIHLDQKIVHLPDTKNNETRDVPLSSQAIKVFETLPRRIDGKVFGINSKSISVTFRMICKNATTTEGEGQPIPDLRFHDLRHEAISRLFEKGLNPMQVASISGHKTLQMLKRYTHLKAEDLAKMLG